MQISIIHPSRFIFKCIFRISPSVFEIGARIGLIHAHLSPFNTNLAERVSSAQIDLELHKVANVEKERVKVDFSLSLSQKCENSLEIASDAPNTYSWVDTWQIAVQYL